MGGKGTFIRHEPCPDCGSKDNVAVYSDGAYCHSCRDIPSTYKTKTAITRNILKTLGQHRQLSKEHELPERSKAKFSTKLSKNLPKDYVRYLEKFKLSKEEIALFNWSHNYHRLSFTIKDDNGEIIGEYLRSITQKPKALFFGNKKHLTLFGKGDIIVLVEDLISAIKVGRHVQAAPLWGVSLQEETRKNLMDKKCIIFWLDSNMYTTAIKHASKLRSMGKHSTTIYTKLDPKDLSDLDIKNKIEDCLSTII